MKKLIFKNGKPKDSDNGDSDRDSKCSRDKKKQNKKSGIMGWIKKIL